MQSRDQRDPYELQKGNWRGCLEEISLANQGSFYKCIWESLFIGAKAKRSTLDGVSRKCI